MIPLVTAPKHSGAFNQSGTIIAKLKRCAHTHNVCYD